MEMEVFFDTSVKLVALYDPDEGSSLGGNGGVG